MRLGGPVYYDGTDPDQWVEAVRARGYRAAYCPVHAGSRREVQQDFVRAAREADIVIAEVGVWNNPLSPDEAERNQALEYCKTQLALADEVGAWCCVNIAGSRGTVWDGPHPDNFTRATFDWIVETVRDIIDAVKPRRTYYTLEPMPWVFPDSPDSYLELIQAIDRERFAAHLDPVNMINNPRRFFQNAAFLEECFEKLGPYIKCVHAKDIVLSEQLTTHLDEVRPGLGALDYRTLLRQMDRLHRDMPILLEHLSQEEEYNQAADYVRSVAAELQVDL